jgi:hypothetical protein
VPGPLNVLSGVASVAQVMTGGGLAVPLPQLAVARPSPITVKMPARPSNFMAALRFLIGSPASCDPYPRSYTISNSNARDRARTG